MFKTNLIIAVLVTLSSLSFSLDYSDLEVIFRASKTPTASKLLGTWVGRCIHRADPYQHWPAFFQIRKTTDFSQSHTWFNKQTDEYDSYSLEDLEKDPLCKKWLENEQWNPMKYENGSLVNSYQYPNAKVWRAIRLYQDGNREHIILAYSLGDMTSDYPASFCFFNVKLPNSNKP